MISRKHATKDGVRADLRCPEDKTDWPIVLDRCVRLIREDHMIAGTFIGVFTGELITQEESLRRGRPVFDTLVVAPSAWD